MPDHIGAGVTTTDDGRLMSVNVEMVGTGLVVQLYIAEEITPTYVRMNSISDVFTDNGRTQVNLIWELVATDAGNGWTCYTNRVIARSTDAFMEFLKQNGIAFADAAAKRQAAGSDHIRRETPQYSESVACRAYARLTGEVPVYATSYVMPALLLCPIDRSGDSVASTVWSRRSGGLPQSVGH